MRDLRLILKELETGSEVAFIKLDKGSSKDYETAFCSPLELFWGRIF
jgi:hypothetical protein